MKPLNVYLKSLIGTLLFLSILFISAGRLDFWQGWLYASINLLLLVLNTMALSRREELAEERSKAGTGAKAWDKRIVGLSAITLIITYVVAGLDAGRFHWSPEVHWSIHVLGAILILMGEWLFLAAQKENRFFSSIVRIQAERGHTVCDTGVYSIVRHPSYLGGIITAIGIPLILGSLWSFLPTILSITLTLVRTSLEDRTLTDELEGYKEYTARTRYRLVPHIW